MLHMERQTLWRQMCSPLGPVGWVKRTTCLFSVSYDLMVVLADVGVHMQFCENLVPGPEKSCHFREGSFLPDRIMDFHSGRKHAMQELRGAVENFKKLPRSTDESEED